MQMATSTERTSRKDKQPRLSDQLKASDLFPPGAGWNTAGTSAGAAVEAAREDARQGAEAGSPPRQH
jgi:hypothetical protein